MTEKNYTLSPDERLDYINEDLSLIQLKRGLTFGTDAYLLAAFVKERAGRGADLGSGTGVASLLCLTKNKTSYMYAAEIQPYYAELIRRNAKLNYLDARLTVLSGDVRDIGDKDTFGSLDVVISNPPYMKAEGGFGTRSEEMNIARRELNGTIEDFCASASRLLKYGGLFYTVYRPDRLIDLICALRSASLEPKKLVTVYPDESSKPCLVLCEAKKGASGAVTMSKPLIIYKKGTREYTEDMEKVYETCSLEHLF
ncbi:MAG: SAM-dependent methyltransferase [Ruminococcaceae bacterium]|nr:SAM-dependent methyltransferase [Oscillospiraceae bacterium]